MRWHIIGLGRGRVAYRHKLFQLLPLHAGREFALFVCVESGSSQRCVRRKGKEMHAYPSMVCVEKMNATGGQCLDHLDSNRSEAAPVPAQQC